MPWITETEYQYTPGLLKKISFSYDTIYDGIVIRQWSEIVDGETVGRERRVSDPWLIAEHKADFDLALSAIGRRHWEGITSSNLSDYKNFGVLQRMVISDILGIPDEELMGLGFYQIPQMKGRAYKWMAKFLNGLPYGTRFIAN